ncbi:hypothetical protein D515_02517 [Grimontia indica]|uniref:Uncharacterized protein n=1 Tax=Grimontia indica TaxID=1056512 RepID=R1GZL2_9GAMM|nr:hypothetical protein D515_02517 [Grimontia indica]
MCDDIDCVLCKLDSVIQQGQKEYPRLQPLLHNLHTAQIGQYE